MGECMELYTPGAALFSILVPSTDFLCFLKSQVRMVVICHCGVDRSLFSLESDGIVSAFPESGSAARTESIHPQVDKRGNQNLHALPKCAR